MLHNEDWTIEDWTQKINSLTSELDRLKHLLADTYYHRGAAYQREDDIHNAFADYAKIKEFDPDYISPVEKYFKKDNSDRTIADSTQAIQQNPNDANAYMKRGAAHSVKGNYDAAFTDLNKAVELNPNDATVYLYRGTAYQQKNDYNKAILDYTKAIQLDPDNIFLYLLRANTYYKEGDYARAAADRAKFSDALNVQ